MSLPDIQGKDGYIFLQSATHGVLYLHVNTSRRSFWCFWRKLEGCDFDRLLHHRIHRDYYTDLRTM
jgi:hypothetical protein